MKNIIFCADGTWNGQSVDEDHDGVPDETNVLKAFHLLAGDTSITTRRLSDEDEKLLTQDGRTIQIAKYIHGVGDSSNPIMKFLGGAFGAGLIARIVRGYTFISRNYEPGDRITVVGFSRGAYTARALAGMISGVGLLNRERFDLAGDKELAYSLGISAWRRYRELAREKNPSKSVKEAIADMVSALPGFARTPLREGDLVAAPVWAIGVWDTVGALGIPEIASSQDRPVDAFRFTDDVLSGNVQYGLHAVSMDEQRTTFLPTMWQARPGIHQYLFAGAHADVGGGYPERESDLANIALHWMVGELRSVGVLFKEWPNQPRMSEDAPIHEPWRKPPFAGLPAGPRAFTDYPVQEHPSIAVRRQKLAMAGMQSPIQTKPSTASRDAFSLNTLRPTDGNGAARTGG